MKALDRVESWIAEGRLVDTRLPRPTSVDFLRALYHRMGAESLDTLSGAAEELSELIGPARHYCFVLLDGFGEQALAHLPAKGFLAQQRRVPLRSVFPSTTAAALASVATAEYPGTHGVTGWWIFLERAKLVVTTLLFRERFGGKTLDEHGVSVASLLPHASLLPSLRHAPATVLPLALVDSPFSRWGAGQVRTLGSWSIGSALRAAADRIKSCDSPSYTYVYLPHVDSKCHELGVNASGVASTVVDIDRQLAALRAELGSDVRLLVSADHGLNDLPPSAAYPLHAEEALAKLLRCPPTGESVQPYFHVQSGRADAFRAAFEERFGAIFALLDVNEVEALQLFGPQLGPVARARIGDFVAIAPTPAGIYYVPPGGRVQALVGVHGGLRPAEMNVPLFMC